MSPSRSFARLILFSLCLPSLTCGEGTSGKTPPGSAGDQHKVFFVGYVYDGARGVRLDKAHLGSVAIKYRDRTISTEIESDGRYVSKEPLPTWQDYAVTIVADGFRAFVSRNPGFDVPASLSMTDGVAAAATTQTFHIDAYMFPVELKAPKLTINIDKSDELVGGMAKPRASGTIRLRPKTSSSLDVAGAAAPGGRLVRRWANDEDLLTQTLTRSFSEGRVEFAEGDLVYGVSYQIAVYDIDGYQPALDQDLTAGYLTSRTVTVTPEAREAPRIVSSNATTCMPPAANANSYGAEVRLVFNVAIEIVGNTFAEEVDNGASIAPTGYSGGVTPYCPLKDNISPTAQERGTRIAIDGNSIVLTFNPFLGINTAPLSGMCMLPATLTSVTYGNLQGIYLRPTDDFNPALRRSLGDLVNMYLAKFGSGGSYSITCPTKI